MPSKKFLPRQGFTKSNIEKVPANKPVVYKIEVGKGKNIYTGSAKRGRVPERLMEHLPTSPDPIKGGATFQVKQMESIEEAQAEEKKIISRRTGGFSGGRMPRISPRMGKLR